MIPEIFVYQGFPGFLHLFAIQNLEGRPRWAAFQILQRYESEMTYFWTEQLPVHPAQPWLSCHSFSAVGIQFLA